MLNRHVLRVLTSYAVPNCIPFAVSSRSLGDILRCGVYGTLAISFHNVCTWAQDERPADLHMAQPNVPVSKTGQFHNVRHCP
jgi:hypothetical protein